MFKFKYLCLLTLIFVSALGLNSCKKEYLERTPSDMVRLEDAFKDVSGLTAAINGIHRTMYEDRDHNQFGQKSIDFSLDLMGNDMPVSASGAGWFMSAYRLQSHRTLDGTPGGYAWAFYYRIISNANQILIHVDSAEGDQSSKDNIKAQALFYRAYAYSYLAQLYQFNYAYGRSFVGQEGHPYALPPTIAPGVPIYKMPTRKGASRGTIEDVYLLIEDDLETAYELLGGVGGPRSDKSQIDASVVRGLQARVALVKQQFSRALTYASDARSAYSYMDKVSMLGGFNDINNPEWMWGSIINIDQTNNVYSFLSHMVYESGGYAALGQQKLLVNTLYSSIPDSDVRKQWWRDRADVRGTEFRPYSQRKFKVKMEGSFINHVPYMRSAEMALIEAEALANLNRVSEAVSVLEQLIKTRDEEYVAPADKNELIREILRQRRIELWGEGFAYLDIMRVFAYPNSVVPDSEKGIRRRQTNHNRQFAGGDAGLEVAPFTNRFLFRIPSGEISTNEALSDTDQNP